MKVLTTSSRSACFELEGKSPYFSSDEFTVYLNGVSVRKECRNVFSLFGLLPDTDYTITIKEKSLSFRTSKESAFFDVREFNAYGDGVHDDTAAFNAAIACLPKDGTLYVPAGTYLVKPIFLKSNMTLYLSEDAVLLGRSEREVYPKLPGQIGDINLGTWQGEEVTCFASLITAYGVKDVTITGGGVVDCNALSGDWYVDHRTMRGAWRPRGLFFNRCADVRIYGLTVKNTPSWNIHPYFCHDVKLYDLNLYNPSGMPTTDGIDPDTCDGVEIVGIKISVGDDCIAIKSGTLEQAKKYKLACRNIVIRNCYMRDGHGGVVLGSELSGGIENISVSKCLFEGTDRGLRIKTRRGRGRIGVTDNIQFSDIIMRGVKTPFVVNMYYNMGDQTGHTEYVYTTEKLPVDERTPYIGSFTFKDMVCTDVEYCAGAFYGLPEAPIAGVHFENVSFSFNKEADAGYPDMKEQNKKVKNEGLYFLFVEKVSLKNVLVNEPNGQPVILNGVKEFIDEN